jgi:hypothetical protein
MSQEIASPDSIFIFAGDAKCMRIRASSSALETAARPERSEWPAA